MKVSHTRVNMVNSPDFSHQKQSIAVQGYAVFQIISPVYLPSEKLIQGSEAVTLHKIHKKKTVISPCKTQQSFV